MIRRYEKMKKIIAILSLVIFFLLLVLLITHEFVGSSYAKHIRNKDIEMITCVFYDDDWRLKSGVIPKDNYDELEDVLEPMRYKIWFGKVKSALIDYIEIEYTNGNTIILSRTYIKSNKNNLYAWYSTYDFSKIKPLIDESTIKPIK